MTTGQYSVKFKGLVDGFDILEAEIKPEFSRQFGLHSDLVDKLFLCDSAVIKKNVTLDIAKRLCEVLRGLGIHWEVIDSDDNVVDIVLSVVD